MTDFQAEVGRIFDDAQTERRAAEDAERAEARRHADERERTLDDLRSKVQPAFDSVKQVLVDRGIQAHIDESSEAIAIVVPGLPGSPRFTARVRNNEVRAVSTGTLSGRGDMTSDTFDLDSLTPRDIEGALRTWLGEIAKAWRD